MRVQFFAAGIIASIFGFTNTAEAIELLPTMAQFEQTDASYLAETDTEAIDNTYKSKPGSNVSDVDKAIFKVHNQLRTNPQSFVPYIKNQIKNFESDSSKRLMLKPGLFLRTNEGKAAWVEALEDLQGRDPVPALKWSDAAMNACVDHVADLGPKGMTGHVGTDDSKVSDRLKRYADFRRGGENLYYGADTDATRVIMGLFIDDGVADRGHRTNLFGDFQSVGGKTGKLKTDLEKIVCIDYLTVKGAPGSSSGSGSGSSSSSSSYKYQDQYDKFRAKKLTPPPVEDYISMHTKTSHKRRGDKATKTVIWTFTKRNGKEEVHSRVIDETFGPK